MYTVHTYKCMVLANPTYSAQMAISAEQATHDAAITCFLGFGVKFFNFTDLAAASARQAPFLPAAHLWTHPANKLPSMYAFKS